MAKLGLARRRLDAEIYSIPGRSLAAQRQRVGIEFDRLQFPDGVQSRHRVAKVFLHGVERAGEIIPGGFDIRK